MATSCALIERSAIAAINVANLNITPSTLVRRGSDESLSSSTSAGEDYSSHHHSLFRSEHNNNIYDSWRDHWAHTLERYERIALGHALPTRRVLGWKEMKEEIGRLPHLGKLGWAGALPVAGTLGASGELTDAWVGWRVKGHTW